MTERTSLHFKDDETLVLEKSFDRAPLEENSKILKAANGRGSFNEGLGRKIASIPVVEDLWLRTIKDPDYLEWIADPCSANKAWHRLLARFPHWVVCEGGIR